MKKLFTAVLFFIAALTAAYAQKDAKARELLDAVSSEYSKTGGVEITFGGTTPGKIILSGNMFVLDCGGIKSWFDGKTQWSYVESNGEVNVSCPTEEELQAVNPYSLLNMYRNGFNYKYSGSKKRNGKMCQEVVLIPETSQDIKSITVAVNSKMQPEYISINTSSGDTQEISVKEYKVVPGLKTDFFRFNKADYPDAEIIDLR